MTIEIVTDGHGFFNLKREDGTLVTDLDLRWPTPFGVPASIQGRAQAITAIESLGCQGCDDPYADWVDQLGVALCPTCLRTRQEEGDADRAEAD